LQPHRNPLVSSEKTTQEEIERATVPYLIVIGTSAGGVQALKALILQLPSDLPAAICIVMHVSPILESQLPHILNRVGVIPAHHPVSKEKIQTARVYVAPPNRHLIVKDGEVILSTAPRENRQRPAIDPLFRSAAEAFSGRTIGVVLTGALDDGTAGLWHIKNRGGITVVQAPDDATHPDMPMSAIESVAVDHVVPISEMGELLSKLCHLEVGL
jgi:two-component system, chemotaxis family, protein-glutamate methylesterase/glutaminase